MTEPVFFTVECDLRAIVADLPNDPDYDGQQAPVSATVTFTPQINRGDIILATNATPRPIGYIPASVTAVVDGSDGRLKLRTTTDAGASGGYTFAPVRLLANSPLLELDPETPLVYRAEFTGVTFFGRPGIIKPIFFEAPSSDVTINLIESGFSQPGQPPTGITKIAPTAVRFEDGTMVFSFAGVDLAEPLPLSEITGPQGDAATIAVGNVTTLNYDQPATVTNTGTAGDAVFDFAIPEGEPATVAVGDVTTLTPEDPATVTNTGTERNAVLDFGIPKGDAATVTVGTVSTVAPGDPATVTNTGTSGDAVLDFGLPQGEAATIAVGTATTGDPGDPVTVTNSGDASAAVFDFTIPQGAAATIAVGDVTTVSPASPATVTNTGTTAEAVFDFDIPQGDKGDAATVTVGTTTTLPPGSSGSVVNTGDSSAAVLDFGIPEGVQGATGPQGDAATIAVGDVTTLSPGASATVTNTGTSGDAIFAFGLPQGQTGLTGATGPTGATGLKGDAASVAIGTVTTVSPTSPASVTNVGTSSAAVLNFSIPKGDTGSADATEWGQIPGQPVVIAAGATEAAARDAIDAEYTGNRGIANGIATLDSAGKVPYSQLPASIMSYQGTWSAATNTPTLADGVGDTGDTYRVTASGTVNLGSGSIEFTTGDYAIYNGTVWEKSDGTDSVSSVAGKTGTVTLTKSDVGLSDVDNTSDLAKPISTATQTALDGKEPTIAAGASGQYWTGNKVFATLDKSAVGLGNVDNTTDLNKPISTATQAALDAKEPTVTAGTTAQYYRGDKTFQTLDKSAVGLSNVDNTSDANKPISAATAFALAGKEPTIASGTAGEYLRGDKTFVPLNKAAVGLGNVDNTADADKPISTATATALSGKEPTIASGTAGQYWRGDKTFATLDKNAVGLGNVDNTADANKNVLSASKLTTARTINGVSFDGTANITVPAGIQRVVQTITAPTTLAAAANTDYVYFLSNGTVTTTTNADPNDIANVKLLLHGDGSNGATVFTDSSTFNRTMTRSGATISTTQSKFGGASMSFSGGQYVSVTSSDFAFGTGDFTVEAWVYPTSLNAYNAILGTRQTSANDANGFSLMYANTGEIFIYNDGFHVMSAPNTITTNAWQHIAFSRSGNTGMLYRNGVQVASSTYSKNNTNTTFSVGAYVGNATQPVTGFIDEVRVSSDAKYTAAFTPRTTPYYTTISTTEATVGTPTLPTAVGSSSLYTLKNISSLNITAGTSSSQTVDGTNTSDSDFSNVATLLHFDTALSTDTAPSPKTWTVANGSPAISSVQTKFGANSLYIPSSSNITATSTAFAFGANEYTVECWVRFDSVSGTNTVAATRASNATISGTWSFGATGGQLFWYDTGMLSGGTITAQTWHHIAAARTGSTLRLFLNGTLVATNSSYSQSPNTNQMWIGSLGNATENMVGYVDDFRITNKCRYTSSFTAPTSPFPDSTAIGVSIAPNALVRLISDGAGWRTV